MRIIGDMVKNHCCCEKNNGQNVQEYKNRISNFYFWADFQPSRCVETYSRAVFHASDRNGVDLVSHSASLR